MRRDMAKVLVERPRFGSSLPSKKKGYRRSIQKMAVEELPRREPMPGRWRGRQRELNEHLGPLRKFLRKNIGRPWNKIHQELCEHISFNNAVQKHVLVHLGEYVAFHVECVQGVLMCADGGRHWALSVDQLYVCPKTGVLKSVQPARRRGRRSRRPRWQVAVRTCRC